MDKDRIEGSAKQAKGAIKQAAGKVTGDSKLKAEGTMDKAEGKLQADFPEGTYKFTADTVDGKKLQGDAALSHKFPDATSLVRPRPDEENVVGVASGAAV